MITKTETPRCDRAYRECLDDTGRVTRMEPIWETMEALERELSDMRENSEYWNNMAADLTNENTKLRDEIERVGKYLREHWHDEYAEALEIILLPNANRQEESK